jgi:hypothetical protein
MHISKLILVLAIYLVSTVTVAAAETTPPEVSVDGLHLVEGTEMARVYAKPGVDLSQYKSIYLVEPQVAFTKDWQRKQNNIPGNIVTNDDMQRMKTDLASLFINVFKQELQDKGGYVVVEEFAEDVLIVLPAIVDLNIHSPATPRNRNSRSTIATAGSMTLFMELIDSVTGDKLVRAFDHKYDRTHVTTRKTNDKRNEAAARDMLGEWAELLRKGLDEARTVVTGN